MTQIIEFTKDSNKYLIHHFGFECNDNTTISNFSGNCSLNKFMSLHDWHQIFDNLSEPVQKYANDPHTKPASSQRKIADTNFQLHITWEQVDTSFYSNLLSTLDFGCVFPYVMKVNVTLRSNIDQFFTNGANKIKLNLSRSAIKEPSKKVSKTRNIQSNSTRPAIENGAAINNIEMKECRVILPMLQLDEIGQVIPKNSNRNKRKHSSLENDDPNGEQFMCSSSSTPFVRNIEVNFKHIEDEILNTFAKTQKRLTNRLTTTPRSSNERNTSTQFNPRIRLLKMPDSVNKADSPKTSNKKQQTGKLGGKPNGKVKKPLKKLKPKVRSLTNESDLFETPTKTKKGKKVMTKTATKPRTERQSQTSPSDNIKLEESDLKSMTETELWQAFDEHYQVISTLFSKYLKQTDPTVQKAGDYNYFNVLSLLTTDQFSIMLDILFEKLVKIGEFGEINYDALFLELLIPEWILAIYMRQYSLGRHSAIDRITSQKSDRNVSYEGLSTLITTKLDDTMNSTKMSNIISNTTSTSST